MADGGYRVLFQGELLRGQTQAAVVGRLSETLGWDRARIEQLFAGPPLLLKRADSRREADRYAELFTRAGARVRIEPVARGAVVDEGPGSGARPPGVKPAVKASFGQRFWLLRAAALVSLLLLLAGGLLLVAIVLWLLLLGTYGRASAWLPLPALWLPLYSLIALAGVVGLTALLKPLLHLRTHPPLSIPLERSHEPDLFDFVAYVCGIVGAPVPKQLAVGMQPRIETVGGPGARLVLSLPLIATTTTVQLGALIAGALTLQVPGLSGRLGRYVHRVNHLLYSAVHERDRLDAGLGAMAASPRRFPAAMARSGEWVLAWSRRLFGYLLKESVGASAAAMRAMERHRDRQIAHVIGPTGFAPTLRKQRLVGFAAARVDAEVKRDWTPDKPMAADLTGYLMRILSACVRPPVLGKVLALAERQQEPISEFHQPDAERVAYLRERGQGTAALACAAPARQLLHAYPMLTRRLTLLHYRNHLGLPVTPDRLPLRVGASPARDRVSAGTYWPILPVLPGANSPAATGAEALADEARRHLADVTAQTRHGRLSLTRYRELARRLETALAEEMLLRAAPPPRAGFRQDEVALEALQEQCRALEAQVDKAYAQLRAVGDRVARRIALALALLACPETGRRLEPAPALRIEAQHLVEALDSVGPLLPQLRELGGHVRLLELLLTCGRRHGHLLEDRIAEQEADLRAPLTAIRLALKRTPDPFRDGPGNRSLFDAARAGFTPVNERLAVLDESAAIHDGILVLYSRAVARLAEITETVEQAWRLRAPATEIPAA